MPVCSFPFVFLNLLSHTLYQVTCNIFKLSLSECLVLVVVEDLKASTKSVMPAFANRHKLAFSVVVLWKLCGMCTSALDRNSSLLLQNF